MENWSEAQWPLSASYSQKETSLKGDTKKDTRRQWLCVYYITACSDTRVTVSALCVKLAKGNFPEGGHAKRHT